MLIRNDSPESLSNNIYTATALEKKPALRAAAKNIRAIKALLVKAIRKKGSKLKVSNNQRKLVNKNCWKMSRLN